MTALANADPLLFLVPGNPQQKTGGYRYVDQVVRALKGQGINASVRGLEGRFPLADPVARESLDQALSASRSGTTLVLDGLAMGGLPEVVEKHAGRLRMVSLVHHPLADETGLDDADRAFLYACETRALAAVSGIITTSPHTARRLADFQVARKRIQVIEPGADTVPVFARTDRPNTGARPMQLLCVASLSPRKAQHQLVQALAELQHLPWQCTLVGSTERHPEYTRGLQEQIRNHALGGRVTLAGELDDQKLAECYGRADLFVLPSLYEGYGMVIDEALMAGLPIISSDGGALAGTGDRPGILQYLAGSVEDLRNCLHKALSDPSKLQELATAARQSSQSARRWADAAAEFTQALQSGFGAGDHSQFDRSWLSLREPADHRARDSHLLARVQEWVRSQQQSDGHPGEGQNGAEYFRVADLGTGAGSNGVYLSTRLPAAQHWTLLEQNPQLLAEARQRLEPKVAAVEARHCTLGQENLDRFIPRNARLVTASALIDLVSALWLSALADAAQARSAGVYIVLSYAGHFELSQPHPDDDWLGCRINEHQHGNKGSGAALGPEATDYLQKQMQQRGYEVALAPSPWDLSPAERQLQAALINGWCEAALEQCPAQKDRIGQWQASRLKNARQGALRIRVHHHDLFAWPGHG